MNYLKGLLLLLTLLAFGCEKEEMLTTSSDSYDAFYIGYGGGWGIDNWYRITDATIDGYVDDFNSTPLEGGYSNPTNWNTVTDTTLVNDLRELAADFPQAAFETTELGTCPEMAFDGVCVRVGYGTMSPDNATIWFRNNAENEVVDSYLERVASILWPE